MLIPATQLGFIQGSSENGKCVRHLNINYIIHFTFSLPYLKHAFKKTLENIHLRILKSLKYLDSLPEINL